VRLDVAPTAEAVEPACLAGVCVLVVDVLRASTTIVTALGNGCRAIVPVAEAEEATNRRVLRSPRKPRTANTAPTAVRTTATSATIPIASINPPHRACSPEAHVEVHPLQAHHPNCVFFAGARKEAAG
jgi:hypothetical protein